MSLGIRIVMIFKKFISNVQKYFFGLFFVLASCEVQAADIAIKIIGCSGGITRVQMDNNSKSSIYISPGMNINSPLFGGTNGLVCTTLGATWRHIWGIDSTDKFDELQVSDSSVFAYTLKTHQHSIFTFEEGAFEAGRIIQCAAYPTVTKTNQVLNVVSAPFTCGQ